MAVKLYNNAEDLDRAVTRYFNSIRTRKPIVVTAEKSGNYTPEDLNEMSDEAKRRLEHVHDLDGNPLETIEWVIPPSEGDLHRSLGMSRETWSQYAKDPIHADTVTRAKAIVEDYYKSQTTERNGNTTGLQFVLRCCYGYKDVQYQKVETVDRLEDQFD